MRLFADLLLLKHEDSIPMDVWHEFFGKGEPKTSCYNGTCIKYPEYLSTYLYECSFQDLKNGAIEIIYVDNAKLLHSNCFFQNCQRSQYGGAILFYNSQGSIVQNKFCGLSCFLINTNGAGLFSLSNLIRKNSNPNAVKESSICLCNNNSEQQDTIDLEHGNISVIYSNFSNNKAYVTSAFAVVHSYQPGIVNYTTVESNIAYAVCLYHFEMDTTYHYCNIIKNSQTSDQIGHIHVKIGHIILNRCSIVLNSYNTAYCSVYNSSSYFILISCIFDSMRIYANVTNFGNSSFTSNYTQIIYLPNYQCDNIQLNAVRITKENRIAKENKILKTNSDLKIYHGRRIILRRR